MVHNLGPLPVQQWVQNIDLQLPMNAVFPGYLPELGVLVPTQLPPTPVD